MAARPIWLARRATTSACQPKRVVVAGARSGPVFDGWPDTLQLNYGNPQLQQAMIGELERIAGQCDGVRCDMAMLVLPDVFESTWGIRAELFLAEGDRGCAAETSELPVHGGGLLGSGVDDAAAGIDYAYDKRLYDRLHAGHTRPVRSIFTPGSTIRTGSPASWKTTTSRGPRLRSHPKCMSGSRDHVPVPRSAFLSPGAISRAEDTYLSPSGARAAGIDRPEAGTVLRPSPGGAASAGGARRRVATVECRSAWEGNWTHDAFVVFAWRSTGGERVLVTVNYGPHQSQCYVRLPFADLGAAAGGCAT